MPSSNLQLHYQPIRHRHTAQPLYYEALLRKGQTSAGSLFDQAEQENVRNRLERQALALAWEDIQSGHTAGRPIAVNVSPKALSEDLGVWRLLLKMARADHVFLEVTENSEPTNRALYRQRLEKLAALGMPLILDDVGSGYAHFTCLADHPFTYAKLDKHYLHWWTSALRSESRQKQILTELVLVFHRQGYQFIQEGIETVTSAKIADAIFPDHLIWFQGFALGLPERKPWHQGETLLPGQLHLHS
ncbi:hypothetical protein A6M27_17940 [Acidithiobacillus thiooxidans]|uniref:EAL domain-containing protein n=1 Tax=Acidithiobacillus thiooxidans TaxID=930 RepID=UPI000464EB9C|nr:EAL domain-containing protein [Acidithiobacillus thiooxidans]OCX73995.1 hypothetical protein A6O24_10805 [Acidithiobacillus thiooxidans]OCX78123.1 hypothetical protein A6O26_18525 [Acidithiobacillus thiooxidans]OCX83153.1 hypothetical protein A6M27_17940 [Acidithiobacillus thiooxidans]OFC50228.1 hypothetical protein BAE47_02720 [Acidithiobacillus thiooxidans]